MEKCVIYIHGKGGNASEAEHYRNLFCGYDVYGFDYIAENPWEAMTEFPEYFDELRNRYESIIVVANSIGAYFTLLSLQLKDIQKAFLISPVTDMEKLITDMIMWAGTDEKTLKDKLIIKTEFGEILDWNYLCWVREHPVGWKIPTYVLYGENDNLQSIETIKAFCEKSAADLTVMPCGEHWFHTNEQMNFLDKWILEKIGIINLD